MPKLTDTIKRLLVILNPRSGWHDASNTFAALVSETLDKSGVVHQVRQVPPEDLHDLLRSQAKAGWEAVCVVGGSGSLNAYAHALTLPQFASWREKPIMLVPSGIHNSLANSLGLENAACSNASIISGGLKCVPLWKASVDGKLLSVALCGFNIGLFADALLSSHKLRDWINEYVSFPMVRRRNFWCTLYHIAKIDESRLRGSLRFVDANSGEVRAFPGGFLMVLASQARFHHPGYSLTPKAMFGKPKVGYTTRSDASMTMRLALTIASDTCERGRMMHLLLREGANGKVEETDGVSMHEASSVEFALRGDSAPRTLLLDGEESELMPGQTLRLVPTDVDLQFFVPQQTR